MWAITVLLLSRYFSPHTALNSSSEETTFPCRRHRYHRILNSVGVRDTSLPFRVHLCPSLEMLKARMSSRSGSPVLAAS